MGLLGPNVGRVRHGTGRVLHHPNDEGISLSPGALHTALKSSREAVLSESLSELRRGTSLGAGHLGRLMLR